MTTGHFKFGDVESGATMLLKVRIKKYFLENFFIFIF
jgi:hypothetical protein